MYCQSRETSFHELYIIQNGSVTAKHEFSDDSVQMIEADVVFGTVTLSSPAKTGMGSWDSILHPQ